MVTLRQVASTLESLQPGQRAWFWFCEQTDRMEIPFVLLPVVHDPSMTLLTEWVETIPMPPYATECVGLAHCDTEGRLHLGSSGVTDGTLPALARWVKRYQEELPGLRRLNNARFVQIGDNRIVTNTFEDPSLWIGIDTLPLVDGADFGGK